MRSPRPSGSNYDPFTIFMASDPPPNPRPSRPNTNRTTQAAQNMTPVHSIAEAWKQEPPHIQQQWRTADAKAKEHYLFPIRWRPPVHSTPQDTPTMSKTVNDLTAGTVGGIAQVLVGQPFDIVKVRMQTAAQGTYSGMLHCAGGILKNEGPLAFYKGTLTPLLGIGACVSIQFGALEYTKRYFARQNALRGQGGPGGITLGSGQLFAAGVAAGLANAVVSGPVEHIRIRLQTQSATKPLYAGPFDAMKQIFSSHGIAGIYKGQVVTLWREALGYGVYFMAYEKLMQYEVKKKDIRRDQISAANAVLFGAAAGYVLWAVIYPIDMIKSRMQTDGFSAADGQKYKSTLGCVRTVWQQEGIAAFIRGLTPTLIRSPFANGATFLAFEMASRVLN
ncbi:putative mitochondrial carrier C4G9.20c [Grifola frondosa]|uniref:Putative mitochondrial carrier C4G9.20c n=1 Tax=Grifola frondosa TaxID=5627 RepID=A0A1C7M383_GRIFR|nr:putative mitochondrial carrier C4G9.20c [Grifola frondosa]